MPDASASGELEVVRAALKQLSCTGRVISVTTDGAATNWGKHSGLLQRLGLFSDSVMCTPHKMNLAVAHVQRKYGKVQQKAVLAAVEMLEATATDFWASSKLTMRFEVHQLAYSDRAKRLVTTKKARWMILRARCARFIELIFVIVEHYAALGGQGDSSKKGRVLQFTNVVTLHIVHVLVDALLSLDQFNVVHQGVDNLVCELKRSWSFLHNMLKNDSGRVCEYEALFDSRVNFDNKTYSCDDRSFDLFFPRRLQAADIKKHLQNNKNVLYQSLMSDIEESLQSGIVSDFSVFDLVSVPSNTLLQTNFINESIPVLRRIYDHFKSKAALSIRDDNDVLDADESDLDSEQKDDLQLVTDINMWGDNTFDQLTHQFSYMVPYMAEAGQLIVRSRTPQPNAHATQMLQRVEDGKADVPFSVQKYNQADAYEKLLSEHGGECGVFCSVVSWMLVFGENTAACERGFSLMNRIKSKHRNLLSHATLRDVMTIISCPVTAQQLDYRALLRDFSTVRLDGAP